MPKQSTRHHSAPQRNGNAKTDDTMTMTNPSRSTTPLTAPQAATLTLTYAGIVAFAIYAILWTPPIIPDTAPPTVFSEQRALTHVHHLTHVIGERQVSTPQVQTAAAYIVEQLEEIEHHPAFRTDLVFDIARETTSGAVNFNFVGINVTNVYTNLTNIVVRVETPRTQAIASAARRAGHAVPKALLVNAHFDSTMGTTGASDCASCVGIGLELLRVIGTNASIELDAPLVVLFNGGEETLMQASHGFMTTSNHNHDLGAFINLESTGPLGVPVMFQHTGAWTASIYASSATSPRGTSMSQDFFECGLIPADTDYKMFSSRHQGTLPGIDVAYVLGGSMYHTFADSVENIRPGTIQELGNNVVGAVEGFTKELAARAAGTSTQASQSDDDAAYYFDVFWYMVVYPKAAGTMLHTAPLGMLLLAPMQMRSMLGERGLKYPAIAWAAVAYALTAVVAVIVPAFASILRVVLSQRPLVFFAHHVVAYAMCVPLALAAFLALGGLATTDVPTAIFGAAWVWGGLGAWATAHQRGAAIYPFLWTAPVLLAYTLTWQRSPVVQLLVLIVSTCIASLVSISSGITLVEHVMDKVNLIGVPGGGVVGTVVADGVVGAAQGIAVVLSAGVVVPAFSAALAARPGLRKRVVVGLVGLAVVVGVYSSVALSPYDTTHPKRVFCQQLHVMGGDGQVQGSHWVVASTDSYPPLPVVQPRSLLDRVFATSGDGGGTSGGRVGTPSSIAPSDSAPSSSISSTPALEHATPIPPTMKRYLFPLSSILQGVILPSPPPSDPTLLPTITLQSKHHRRRSILIDTGRPCWGLVNITAVNLTAWSFTQEPTSVQPGQHMVRFAGNEGAERLEFWIEAEQDAPVRLELTTKYFVGREAVEGFGRAHFGHAPWVAYTGMLVYHVDVDVE